jgi:hypothetical protein
MVSLAPRRARTEPPAELTTALARGAPDTPDPLDPPAERDFADRANKLLDTAEAVTDRVERVTNTVQALLEGRIPDPDLLSEDLMDSLALLQRLTQSGRLAEVIKLGRPLCRLFALTLRWAALVETLRLVFHAATALADTPAIAWTQHELGTLHGSVGNVERARDLLNQARRTREAIGDCEGLRATDHNLTVLSGRPAFLTSTAALVGVVVVVLIVATFAFTQTLGGGSVPGSVASSSTSSTTTRSSTTTSASDSITTSHSTTRPTAPGAVPRPGAVTFPATLLGGSASTDVELVNTGTGPLTVNPAQISDAPEFTIGSDICSREVIPDDRLHAKGRRYSDRDADFQRQRRSTYAAGPTRGHRARTDNLGHLHDAAADDADDDDDDEYIAWHDDPAAAVAVSAARRGGVPDRGPPWR